MQDKDLTVVEHLTELRSRIIKSLICILLVGCIVFAYVDTILILIIQPVVGKLIFIAPQEAFVTQIHIAFFAGLFISLPFILYQIWAFVSIALLPHERKYILIFGPLSFIFFCLGALFGYMIIVPIGISFLLAIATEYASPMITISRYVSFVVLFPYLLFSLFAMRSVKKFR